MGVALKRQVPMLCDEATRRDADGVFAFDDGDPAMVS
jgi:hypothetical protein